MENLGNDFSTTLSAAITDGITTSITVASGTGAPTPNFRIRIDDEIMVVTSVGGGTNWTVTRGAEGTTATTHSNGSVVPHVVSIAGLQQWVYETGDLVKNSLDEGVTKTVPSGFTFMVPSRYLVEGTLIVDGVLVVVE